MRPFARPNPFPCLLALALAFGGCADNPLPPGPQDALFVYTHGGEIDLVRGDGNGLHKVIGGDYIQASLSPDKTQLACVYRGDFYVSVFHLDPNFDVDGKPKSIHNAQATDEAGKFPQSFYPVWSSDGHKLYFLNANHLVVYDDQAMGTTVLFDFPENQSGGPSGENGGMNLSEDGRSLYCMLGDGTGQTAFWSFDLVSNAPASIATLDRTALSTFTFPDSFPEDAVKALFGSKENPVQNPFFSAGDPRYYAYIRESKNLLSRVWLEGYDRQGKNRFEVATLGRSINLKNLFSE